VNLFLRDVLYTDDLRDHIGHRIFAPVCPISSGTLQYSVFCKVGRSQRLQANRTDIWPSQPKSACTDIPGSTGMGVIQAPVVIKCSGSIR